MTRYLGIWNLKDELYCKSDVSGQIITNNIGSMTMSFSFPICSSEEDDPDNNVFYNDLKPPIGVDKEFKVDSIYWGTRYTYPGRTFGVHSVYCVGECKEDELKIYYDIISDWMNKFYNLNLLYEGKFFCKNPNYVSLLSDEDDICLFKRSNDSQKLQHIQSYHPSNPVQLSIIDDSRGLSLKELSDLFAIASNVKPINLTYELLVDSYRALKHEDYRSSITIAGSALESAIVSYMRKFYIEKGFSNFDSDRKAHRMLWKEFEWLKEHSINIPIADYQDSIINVRNETTHEGKNQDLDVTARYLNNCRTLIDLYQPEVLE